MRNSILDYDTNLHPVSLIEEKEVKKKGFSYICIYTTSTTQQIWK